MNQSKFTPIVLTDRQEAWLSKHFKHTKNEAIAKHLNISLRSVSRLARRRGLEKSKQFMKKCQQEAADKANISHRINGTYPPKGYRIPGSEKYLFQKGVRPVDRIGRKREAERIAKAAETRKQTFKLEKARALFGLPQQTRLSVVKHPREQIP